MNEYEMVVAVVTILAVAAVIIALVANRRGGEAGSDAHRKLAGEVKALNERLSVLERITVEKENSLAREIEDLRERTPA